MELAEAKEVAYRCHRVLEPLHSMIYFAPEAEERYTEVGLRPGRMCYFASRAAPMGAVGPGVVAATFFNFNPEVIGRHIPRAWTLADPREVVQARFAAADAALRRLLGDELAESETVTELGTLLREVAEGCVPEGRPLYAGLADQEWPDDPLIAMWHGVSLLREFRGDGHIAALVGAGLNGLTALITHTATGAGFLEEAAKKSRGWSEEEWAGAAAFLQSEGLLDAAGQLTDSGKALREGVEDTTNFAAAGPWKQAGAEKSARVHELARELSRAAVAGGAFPASVFGTKSEKAPTAS